MDAFHRKLMKYWIQSFLLGVPKIIVGFRTADGILVGIQEIETHRIPETVNSRANARWNADMCVNFASAFLECASTPCQPRLSWPTAGEGHVLTRITPGLSNTITDEGVWRINRRQHSPVIELSRVEATGHGNILLEEFKNWRIKLALGPEPEGSKTPARDGQEA